MVIMRVYMMLLETMIVFKVRNFIHEPYTLHIHNPNPTVNLKKKSKILEKRRREAEEKHRMKKKKGRKKRKGEKKKKKKKKKVREDKGRQ